MPWHVQTIIGTRISSGRKETTGKNGKSNFWFGEFITVLFSLIWENMNNSYFHYHFIQNGPSYKSLQDMADILIKYANNLGENVKGKIQQKCINGNSITWKFKEFIWNDYPKINKIKLIA